MALLMTLLTTLSMTMVGCGGGYWPPLTKGYIDYNQDGKRQIGEYVDPSFEFSDRESILFVNRLIRDRRGESLKLIVFAPNREIVFREASTINPRSRITHYQVAARNLVEQGGYGTYLVNWRIGEDTIDSYEFEIFPDLDSAMPMTSPKIEPVEDDLPAMWEPGLLSD